MTVPVAPSTVTTQIVVRGPGVNLASASLVDVRWPGVDEMSLSCPALPLPAGRWLVTAMVSAATGALNVCNQSDVTIASPGSVAVPAVVIDVLRPLSGTTAVEVAISVQRRDGSSWRSYALGRASLTVPTAPAATPALHYGSSVHPTNDPATGAVTGNGTSVPLRPYLDVLVDAGADMVRIGGGWSWLEPGSASFNAAYAATLDTIYADCAARNLKVLAFLGGVPAWAGGKPTGSVPTNADIDAWVDAYLARWHPYAVEFDNEPNIGFGYGGAVAASATARVMREVYLRAKAAAQPPLVGLNVAFGDAAYLQGVYNAAVGTCFDYVSIHPYYIASLNIGDLSQYYGMDPAVPWVHDDVSPYTYASHGQGHWVQAATAIYRTMRANGDAAKPVWITEGGWSSSLMIPNAQKLACSEAQQADYTALALRQVARCPFVETVLTYSTYDEAPNPQTTWTSWGMTRYSPPAEHKPLWQAWKDTVAGIKAGTL